ncbi:MAG: DUF86 domain-containing protein [Acidobacteria bacterium]|nr:DUF86 domain-containing protein [Acidobacteriota bacterium]MBV9478283.1 DUF86 domain-containing protein [Acidobacteriota bacterium]
MKEHDDRFYLQHMRTCIANIEDDTSRGRAEFEQNRTERDAVMRNLQLLAESSMRLSDETRARFPDVEWRQMRKFRNVVVHDYTDIDYDVIWLIVSQHVPALKPQIERMLKEL